MIGSLTADILDMIVEGGNRIDRKRLLEYASIGPDVRTSFDFLVVSLRSTPAADRALRQITKNSGHWDTTNEAYRRLAHNRLQGRCTAAGLDFIWESRRAYGAPEFKLKYIAFTETDSEESYWIEWHSSLESAEESYEEQTLLALSSETSCASLTESSVAESEVELDDDDCFAVHHSLKPVDHDLKASETVDEFVDESESMYWERYNEEVY